MLLHGEGTPARKYDADGNTSELLRLRPNAAHFFWRHNIKLGPWIELSSAGSYIPDVPSYGEERERWDDVDRKKRKLKEHKTDFHLLPTADDFFSSHSQLSPNSPQLDNAHSM